MMRLDGELKLNVWAVVSIKHPTFFESLQEALSCVLY